LGRTADAADYLLRVKLDAVRPLTWRTANTDERRRRQSECDCGVEGKWAPWDDWSAVEPVNIKQGLPIPDPNRSSPVMNPALANFMLGKTPQSIIDPLAMATTMLPLNTGAKIPAVG